MKNLKQLILPCYKVEMVMGVEAWYFLHGTTGGVCNLTYFLSLLSGMAVTEVRSTKRGLGYTVGPGQTDRSMLALAGEWGIGRKAVSRLLEDFSERGLIHVVSNPMTSIIDMACVKSWMVNGRIAENPTYRQTLKAYEGVRIYLFNGQKLETLRRSLTRKKAAKTANEADNPPSMKTAAFIPLIDESGTMVYAADESGVKGGSVESDSFPVLENGDTSDGSRERKQTVE